MQRSKPRRADASGRFLLRVNPQLHAALRRAAEAGGMSLNDYCARKLTAPIGNVNGLRGGTAAVERAAALLGSGLVGVVAYGSWARGEAADSSDVDVLVVVDTSVALSRALYRAWDERPVTWEGRPVEVHFTHMPAFDERVGGVWAEAAIDGIVLFERGVDVSSRLVAVRHEILAGRLVRRVVHGQPYWAEVA